MSDLDIPSTMKHLDISSTKQQSRLELLPLELKCIIVKSLTYPTLIALSQTNHYFHSSIHPPSSPPSEKSAFLKVAETFPQHAESFGCYHCFRVLPRIAFAENQIKKKHGKGKAKGSNRLCFACGVAKGLYRPRRLQWIVRGEDASMRYCNRCRRPRKGLHCDHCRLCEGCLGLTEKFEGVVCPRCCFSRIVGERVRSKGESRYLDDEFSRWLDESCDDFPRGCFIVRVREGRR